MMCFRQVTVLLFLLAVAAGGCRLFDEQAIVQGRSLLPPARQSPDSVALEMMWVRLPAGDPLVSDAAWQDIDETPIDSAVRRELANNGFRAGVIRGALPDALARALDGHTAATDDTSDNASPDGSNTAIDLVNEPIVRGRRKQLRRHERWEIQASDVYPSMPLLTTNGRELGGRTYSDGQAIYALGVDPQPDRTVLTELTPELHYGQSRLRFTGGEEGVLRSMPMRDREVFDRMRLTVRLAPGEILVLMSMPNAGCRLGEYFHTVDSPQGRQQKLILLRLVQVPPSDTFAAEH
ncbi:MAG: hypothetical protein WD669_07945 [Pirellulales bacterium]